MSVITGQGVTAYPLPDEELSPTSKNAVSNEAVCEGLDEIRNAFDYQTDDALGTWIKGAYYNTSGTTIDVSSPTDNANFICAVFDCAEGDLFNVKGIGGSIAYCYSFINNSGAILSKVEQVQNDALIQAPENVSKLVFNDKSGDGYCKKAFPLCESFRYRQNVLDLGYTSLRECVKNGWYGFGSSDASSISDLPSDFGGAGLLEIENKTYKRLGASNFITQKLYDIYGNVWIRIFNTIGDSDTLIWTRKSPDSALFLNHGYLNSLGYTSLLQCNSSGWYGFPGSYVSSISDLPSDYPGYAGTVIVYEKTYGGTSFVTYVLQELTDSKGSIWRRSFQKENSNIVFNWVHIYSPVATRKWLAIGDSITHGYFSVDNDGTVATGLDTTNCWAALLAVMNKLELINVGVGSSGYLAPGSEGTQYNGKQIADNIDFSGYDVITIAYGLNDWKYNYTLGSMSDAKTANTLYGAMKYVFETIQGKNKNAKIIVISPINCCMYGTESLNWGAGYAFSNNGTLKQVSDAIKEVCEYYGIEFVDMLSKSAVNRINIETALPDTVHPSKEMHKQMACQLSRYIH